MAKIYNILLLGETGVGKSTFINAFANYLNFPSMSDARKNDLICLIPTWFTVLDKNTFEQTIVKLNDDDNEKHVDGQSTTQRCMAYVFQFRDYKIRFIDTPGVGDTRGIDQDRANFENLLGFISNYKELHAICILLKPNHSRLNVSFEFCLKQLLSQLEKSASQNIMFLFTNTRSTFYSPGETVVPLKKMLDEVKDNPPFVTIPFNRDTVLGLPTRFASKSTLGSQTSTSWQPYTVYCFDNEAFRFLVASKSGVSLIQDEQFFHQSWEKSVDVCVQLIDRIVGVDGRQRLPPHQVRDTISVNRARQLIVQLTQPLADIAENIQDNLKILNQKQNEINQNVRDIDELNSKLFIPALDLKVMPFAEPRTVCKGPNCRQIYTIGKIEKYQFDRKCHDPCYCTSKVKKNIFGKKSLKHCAVMGWDKKCRECNCKHELHKHIYYGTEVVEVKIMDNLVIKAIQTKEEAKKKVEVVTNQLRQRSMLLEEEKRVILNSTGRFAHYLKNNAITPYNDAFKEYMKHLIENEKTNDKFNNETTKGLEQMLAAHEQEKKILDDASAPNSLPGTTSKSNSQVTTDEVFDMIDKLFDLPIMGCKIKESFNAQSKLQMRENVAFRELNVPKAVAKTKFTNKDVNNNTNKDTYKDNNKGNNKYRWEVPIPQYKR